MAEEAPRLELEVDGSGNTALDRATMGGNLEEVQRMADEGADLDAPHLQERRPVHWASELGKLEVLACLVERGARLDLADEDGNTPLSLAMIYEQPKVVEWLLTQKEQGKEICVDLPDRNGNVPLDHASIQGSMGLVELLTDHVADLDAPHQNGATAVHWASEYGHTEVLAYLAKKGAKLDLPDKDGAHPVHLAAHRDRPEAVDWLTDPAKGNVPIDQLDKNGDTPLDRAICSGSAKVVELLADKGADLEAPHNKGKRPVHLAAESDELGILEFLVKRGAKLDVTDRAGSLPIDLAARWDYDKVVAWIKAHTPEGK